ncbi:hypothetical protein GCM10010916_49190 [Paenibacillus abyssi]|uniref:Transposase IS116/IS110/IS902 C-terminal domain-containing protein n=1 Tax=Paenibacillus abyssi TaxID=1340531 RepID=A0A917LIH9_9BACL|nr:transposase [Paenibacillus abyssi]GGG26950.1 hypothetical protein GCM10010916_49190 [Paenibacillus abyssi]
MEENIDALAEEIQAYDLIQSIPGISHKIAATILSELGEFDRFDQSKKLSQLMTFWMVVFIDVKLLREFNGRYKLR